MPQPFRRSGSFSSRVSARHAAVIIVLDRHSEERSDKKSGVGFRTLDRIPHELQMLLCAQHDNPKIIPAPHPHDKGMA